MALQFRRRLNQQVYEEAGSWFVRFRTGTVDESGRRDFDQHVRSSPEFLRAYLEMTAIWNEAPKLDAARRWDSESLIAAARAADDEVISLNSADTPASLFDELAPWHRASRKERRIARRWAPWAIGAGLAAGAALAIIVGMLYRPGIETFSTATGEQRLLTFADGSTVDLNTRSKIEVRYSSHERDVRLLEGEALFHVAKDPSRPFIVGSGSARVRAVGTEFDVYARRSATIVSVLEGRVEVEAPSRAPGALRGAAAQHSPSESSAPDGAGAHTLLSAGYRLVVTAAGLSRSTRLDPAATIAWTQQQLVFDSTTVTDIAEQFNRYNARSLIVEGTLRDVRLSGVFSTTNPMAFVRFLQDRFGARVTETGSEIRVHN